VNPTYLQPLLQLRLACKRVVDLRGQCGELQAAAVATAPNEIRVGCQEALGA